MAPACRDALINHLRVYPNLISPIKRAHTTPIMFKDYIAAIVARLLQSRSPAAIVFAVRPVIVDAIKRKPFDVARAHVLNEVKRVVPSLVYNNASAAVAMVSFVRWLVASVMHAAPHNVQRLAPQSMRGDGFTLAASAASAGARAKLVKSYRPRWTAAAALAGGVRPAVFWRVN